MVQDTNVCFLLTLPRPEVFLHRPGPFTCFFSQPPTTEQLSGPWLGVAVGAGDEVRGRAVVSEMGLPDSFYFAAERNMQGSGGGLFPGPGL